MGIERNFSSGIADKSLSMVKVVASPALWLVSVRQGDSLVSIDASHIDQLITALQEAKEDFK